MPGEAGCYKGDERDATVPYVSPIRERVLDVEAVAAMMGVRRQTVHVWRTRGVMAESDMVLSGAPAWYESTVLAWAHRTGRQPINVELRDSAGPVSEAKEKHMAEMEQYRAELARYQQAVDDLRRVLHVLERDLGRN